MKRLMLLILALLMLTSCGESAEGVITYDCTTTFNSIPTHIYAAMTTPCSLDSATARSFGIMIKLRAFRACFAVSPSVLTTVPTATHISTGVS